METLTRTAASEAVSGHGWRYLLGTLRTAAPVGSLAEAAAVATRAVEVCGADAPLHLDLRPDRVLLTLRAATVRTVELARLLTTALPALAPDAVQALEIAIDALDIPAVMPFWKAVLGYADGPDGDLVDPRGQSPAVWFQQMDAPRPQRNRIHFDVCVPHDVAQARVEAALAAGGTLVTARWAPAFWVLADPEGNEACVTTWQGRDQ